MPDGSTFFDEVAALGRCRSRGYFACDASQSLDDNPHVEGTPEHAAWRNGFYDRENYETQRHSCR